METRGRKPKLKNPKTISVIVETEHTEMLKIDGINASEFVRNCLEIYAKNRGSNVYILKKEIEDIEEQAKNLEILKHYKMNLLKEEEEKEASVDNIKKEQEELDTKRHEHIISRIDLLNGNPALISHLWLGHLMDVYKFNSQEEAKKYILEVWVEEGKPETKVRKFLRLD
jgi:hypothetical protein